MTVGDFRPAPSIGAMHGPTRENLDFRLGFTAGYQARVREEIESWKAVIEGGQLVAFGDVIKTLPFADREAARMKTVREAHDAGVHGHSARGCPWCGPHVAGGES